LYVRAENGDEEEKY